MRVVEQTRVLAYEPPVRIARKQRQRLIVVPAGAERAPPHFEADRGTVQCAERPRFLDLGPVLAPDLTVGLQQLRGLDTVPGLRDLAARGTDRVLNPAVVQQRAIQIEEERLDRLYDLSLSVLVGSCGGRERSRYATGKLAAELL